MRYIDISTSIQPGMPAYPDDPPVELMPWSRRAAGSEFNVTALRFGSHTGTHVDSPSHCIDGGVSVAELALDALCGPVFVLDLATQSAAPTIIPPQALDNVPAGIERLIVRTRNSEMSQFRPRRTAGSALSEAAALKLVASGILLIGIDQLSIAPPGAELVIHRLLLKAGVIILEGLELAAVQHGRYQLLCLPLKIAGCDGAPARAVLVE